MRRSWSEATRQLTRRLPANGQELRRDVLTIADTVLLALRNRLARRTVLAVEGPRVSLTTYGRRVRSVHLAIESIARGELRPSAITLWLDDPRLFENLPATVRRLVRRGLEVRLCNPIGSHAKYYPTVACGLTEGPLVTADDDILYPRAWLKELVRATKEHPHDLIAFRAKSVEIRDGELRPYVTWPDLRADDGASVPFVLGVHGVLYPPSMVEALRIRGAGFLETCLRADDIWINLVALENDHDVRVLEWPRPAEFRAIRGMRSNERLSDSNVAEGGNDRQLQATFGTSRWVKSRLGLSAVPRGAGADVSGGADGGNDRVDRLDDLSD